MADVDELLLQVSANASDAIQNLSKLQNSLRGLSRDIGTFSAAGTSLHRAFNGLNKIANLDIGKLTRVTDAVRTLNDISGKTIKIDIQMAGASEAERKVYAIQTAINNIDTSSIARKLADALGNNKVGTYKKMLDKTLESFASGNGSSRAIGEVLMAPIEKAAQSGGLKVPVAFFDSYVAEMKSEYESFLSYLSAHPIALTRGVNDKLFFENASAYERMKFFSKEGSKVDEVFSEIIGTFPSIMAGMEGVTNEEDMVYQLLMKIREAMNGLGTVDIKDLTPSQSQSFWNNLLGMSEDTYQDLAKQFNEEVDKAMQESRNKIPLNVAIDSEMIKQQIDDAVKAASSQEYKLDVKLAVNTNAIQNAVFKSLSGVSTDNIQNLSQAMKDLSASMANMKTIDFKKSGINGFISSVRRLGEADTSKFDPNFLNELYTGASAFANMDDISNGVNRLIASIVRIASAGDSARIATVNIKPLGKALREVVKGFSTSGGIPALFGKGMSGNISASINQFVASLSNLANAGEKVGITAQQLADLQTALVTFINNMANLPEVNQNLALFVSGLGQLASSGTKAGKAGSVLNNVGGDSKKTGSSLRQLGDIADKVLSKIRKLFGAFANKITSLAKTIASKIGIIGQSSKSLFSVSDGIKSVIGGLIGFRGLSGIFNWTKEAVQMGADITEIDHIVESVFGQNMVGYVDKWAKAAIGDFGIAEHSAKQYAGTLSAMFQASNVDVESAGTMAMRLTELAGDLSAFFNIDTETAFNKIRSGMAGMVRPLRDLGIDMTAATLKEYALSQGITKSYQSMTQAEKILLRYNYLMSATTTQQGDFQRTNLSLANSMRTLKAYAAAVTTQIGAGFASALRHVVVLLNQLMKYLLSAATAFSTFMQTIFGKYKGGASGIAVDMSGIADDLEDAGDSAASGLGSAADSAKKIKKDLSVLPFDELNQLNKDSDSTSSGTGSGGDGGGAIGIDLDDMFSLQDEIENSTLPDAISEWGRRIKKAFNLKDWQKLGNEIAWGINQGIEKVYGIFSSETIEQRVVPFIQHFTQTLNSLTSSIHWGDMGTALGAGVNTLFTILNEAIGGYNFGNLGANIAFFLNGAITEIDFGGIGKFFGKKFMILWDFLDSAVHKFRWDKLGQQLAEGISSLNKYINLSTVASTLSGFINGIFTTLGELAEHIPWGDIAQNIIDGITTFIRTTDWKKNGEALGKFIKNLCDALVRIAKETPWDELGEGIATTLAELPWGTILSTVATVMVEAIGGLLKGLCSKPEGAVVLGIIAGLEAISLVGKLSKFVNTVGSAIEGANWTGLSGIFKKIFQKGIEEGSQAAATAAQIGGSGAGSSALGAGAGAAIGGSLALGGGLLAGAGASIYIGKTADKMLGGNGQLSETAATFEELGRKLRDLGTISNEENTKLWDYIEGMESVGASYEETALGVMQKLHETGLTTDEVREALELMRAEQIMTNDEFEILNQTFAETQQASQGAAASYQNNEAAMRQMSNTSSQVAQETKKNNEVTFGSVSELASWVQKQWNDTSNNVQKNSEKANTSVTRSLSGINQAYSESVKHVVAEYGVEAKTVSDVLNEMQRKQDAHTQKTKEQYEQQYQNTTSNLSKTKSAYEDTRLTSQQLMAKLTNDILSQSAAASQGFTKNFTDGFDKIASAFKGVTSNISSELQIMSAQMYQAGRTLSQQLNQGLNSIWVSFPNIKLPHIGWWWNQFDFGGTWFNIPSFYVNWYKSGGLFMGGDGQIVGLAEGGKDEAVLPLENKRAMARIANAIVDANSGMGFNSQEIADAVAVGVSTAMMNNSGNNQNQMLYVEVKTENDEVLARAVTRGQRKIGQRFNISE